MENLNQSSSSALRPLTLIGSHNTMSYLKPAKWWMKPLRIFAQCQDKDIEQQIMSGASCVDIRVYNCKEHGWCFAHGLVKYKGEKLFSVLNKLAWNYPGIVVRIILERASNQETKDKFANLCQYLEKTYSDIHFIGGFYKKTWESLYAFELNYLEIHQFVSSMADDARWYERILPIAYAKRITNYKYKPGINLIDFI